MQNIPIPTTLQERIGSVERKQKQQLEKSAKDIAEQIFSTYTINWNEQLATRLKKLESDTGETLKSLESEIGEKLGKTIQRIYSETRSNQAIISFKMLIALTVIPATVTALIGVIAWWIIADKMPSEWEATTINGEKVIIIPQTGYKGQTADNKLIFKGK